MQKQCTRCLATKPLADFNRRALSADGRTAACAACIRSDKQIVYWVRPGEREKASARASQTKQQRFEKDPAYKRAFNLWGTTKKRTTIPACMTILDFVPICKKAIAKGLEYELDHRTPLKHPLVCGLHVPWNLRVVKRTTNQRKSNRLVI
jgi:hypothetical protein